MDMLHGTIGDKLLYFAILLAATEILQQLFNAADIAVVGRCVGKEAMAAVGANVVIARFIGQKNAEGMKRTVHIPHCCLLTSGIINVLLNLSVRRVRLS